MSALHRHPGYESDAWEIDLARRELRSDGVSVPIGSRAFEIVEALIRSGGELVTKNDLMDRVWPAAVVEENTLRVHISAVRKALGPRRDMLKTVPGRGYCLLGSWTIRNEPRPAGSVALEAAPSAERTFQTNLPMAPSHLIGRTAAARRLRDLLSAYRVVTLIGPGGIGKTALAVEVARDLLPIFQGDVWLVELVSLSDAGLVPSTVAGVLGLKLGSDEILPESVARAIASRRLLLVVDNCEHVIDAAAGLVETIVRLCPRISVLATSREALRIEGEHVYRVPPLDVPSEREEEPNTILGRNAVRLFISRMRALDADIALHGKNLPAIAAICRRLDGIPLAIEFAAARAATVGIHDVAARLDDRFRLLTDGRRTALPQHQTLRATLDWSYDLLSDTERKVLCRLGVFVGAFALEAAEAVASFSGDVPHVAACVADLVARSLINLESTSQAPRYRLLETMRAYALVRLSAREAEVAKRQLLEFYLGWLKSASRQGSRPAAHDGLLAQGGDLENIRAALNWSLGSGNAAAADIAAGARLAVASMPLWLESSLHMECRQWAERALAALGPDDRQEELVLQVVRGSILLTTGGDESKAEPALQRGLALADACGEREYALRAIYGLWVHALHDNDYRTAYSYAERFRATAALGANSDDLVIGDRLLGASEHYLGRQREARCRLERVLSTPSLAPQRFHESRFGLDQRVAALSLMARVNALQGMLEQALDVAREAIEVARKVDRAASLCHALGEACIVSLWVGERDQLPGIVEGLLHHTERYGLRFWRPHALVARGVVSAMDDRRGDANACFAAVLDEVGADRFDLLYPSLIGTLVDALAGIGKDADARSLTCRALGRPWVMERWYGAELLIVRARLTLASSESGLDLTEEGDLERALILAREQSSLLLELRAATGLAECAARAGRPGPSIDRLRAVYSRFSEGFETAHLKAAARLIGA
jgi:predicted ATPase/DNA-binding winged helix-turn-helix (wHTH) protein